ncbi:MAG: hypothetical protein ACPLTR_09285 [Thermacetogeniaceae bacterium]
MAKRGYFSGLITGGLVGAIAGLVWASRTRTKPRTLLTSRQMGDRAKKIFRGISRGMLEMMRR